MREVANPKATRKNKIGEENEIKALGSVCLSGYLGQSGKFCTLLGIPSSSTAQGGGVTLKMNRRWYDRLGAVEFLLLELVSLGYWIFRCGGGICTSPQSVWHGFTNASFIALENMLYFASYGYQKQDFLVNLTKICPKTKIKKSENIFWRKKRVILGYFCIIVYLYFFVLWYYHVEYLGGGICP